MTATARNAYRASEEIVRSIMDSKDAISEMLEGGTKRVGRYLKNTGRAAEDLIDETGRHIKRAPFGSVAVAFVAGALLGVLMFGNGRR